MKTYIFDTFNRYKRFSEELDAQTILCNKAWWVFNDSGEKELYIFNTDGSLIISVSGRVTNATWQYIAANKSLIITGNNQSYMVHPAFYDNQVFALQIDGTNHYTFLINENNLPTTSMRSLSDLRDYFAEIERQAVLAEKQKLLNEQKQKEIETQKRLEEERRQEVEKRRKHKEDEKRRIEKIYISIGSKSISIGAWINRFVVLAFFVCICYDRSWYSNLISFLINNEWHMFLVAHIGDWITAVKIIEFIGIFWLIIYFTLTLPTNIAYKILVQEYEEENWYDIEAIKFLKSHKI